MAPLLLLLISCISCSEKTPEGPTLAAVDPSRGPADQATPVRILGSFRPLLRASYDDPSQRLVTDTTFTARLGGVDLAEVTYVGPGELHAVVTAGRAAGVHDLEVLDPRGQRGALAAAFTIGGPADASVEARADAGQPDARREASAPDLAPDLRPRADVRPGDGCTPQTGWWNVAYRYRQRLTVTQTNQGGLPAGYSLRATLDAATAVAGGQLQASGDDLRVVGAAGELDRRLVDAGSAQAQIWFRTAKPISGSSTDYWLYFGAPGASSPPARWADMMGAASASAVYLAADDFESDLAGIYPNGWEGSPAYKVQLDGTNKVLNLEKTASAAGDLIFAGNDTWGDVVVEARLKILQAGSGQLQGVFTRVEAATAFSALWFGLSGTQTLEAHVSTLATTTAPWTPGAAVAQWPLASPAGTGWHSIEVRQLAKSASFRFDGTAVGSYTNPGTNMAHGRVGLGVGFGATHVHWDDVVVRRYVSPEPTVTLGPLQFLCQ